MDKRVQTDPNATGIPLIHSPFFETLINHLNLSQSDKAMLKDYREHGYIILNLNLLDEFTDEIIRCVADLYQGQRRIQDAWKTVDCVRGLAVNEQVLSVLRMLYQREPLPFQTLNFPVGTQQRAHSDTIHFQSYPHNFMCGVWVALEDVDQNNGPLFYYPGSHLLPPYDLGDLNLRGTRDNYARYEDFLEALVLTGKFKRATIQLKKGQAVVWAANLIHGGSKIADVKRTRHSQVTHYYFEGCRYYTPMLSDVYNKKIAWRTDQILNIRTGQPISHFYLGQPVTNVQASGRSRKEDGGGLASRIRRAFRRRRA